MDARQFIGGKFLKKEDAEKPALLTISRAAVENVAQDGQPEERKLVLYFAETDKGLVLNTTNAQTCFDLFGTWETDAWLKGQVVLFADPSVSFGGKKVGGLRLRAPRTVTAGTGKKSPLVATTTAATTTATAGNVDPDPEDEDFDDDIPF